MSSLTDIPIDQLLPHRYPMLLVDRVMEIEQGDFIIASKNVSNNEWFFPGHFPGKPIMPGVLMIEAAAQAAVLLMCGTIDVDWEKKSIFLTKIDNATFRKTVIPGDVLILEVRLLKKKDMLWKMKGIGKVREDLVFEAEFSAVLVDKNRESDHA